MKLSNEIWMDFGDGAVPAIPKGYTVHLATLDDGQDVIACRAPVDKRKSRGRVPKEPKLWFLMTNARGDNFWIPKDDFHTRPLREYAIAQGLEMEIKFPGFQMTAKAPKCSTILRQEYGMKGKPADLLEQFLKFRCIDLKARGEPANLELR
jgi:hypothetical protein